MLNARALNTWAGTRYTLDEVSEMDPLLFVLLSAIRQAQTPPEKGKK